MTLANYLSVQVPHVLNYKIYPSPNFMKSLFCHTVYNRVYSARLSFKLTELGPPSPQSAWVLLPPFGSKVGRHTLVALKFECRWMHMQVNCKTIRFLDRLLYYVFSMVPAIRLSICRLLSPPPKYPEFLNIFPSCRTKERLRGVWGISSLYFPIPGWLLYIQVLNCCLHR
jgi:hypothetical protein